MIKITFCFLASIACFANGINTASRIINGDLALDGEFPYAVSIQGISTVTPQPETRNHRCGGVLFTLQHVLTSASCLHNYPEQGPPVQVDPSQLRVFAGSAWLTNDTNSPDRIRLVMNYAINPHFHHVPANFHDIAVVTLAQAFPAQSLAVPMRLPAANFEPAEFDECTVVGWGGIVADGIGATVQLRKATKYIYNQNLCTLVYNINSHLPNIFPTMLCAASFDVLSSGCPGDTGNALVCGNTLTGILFHHNGCDVVSTFPELYTRVNNFTTWIRTISAAEHSFVPGMTLVVLAAIVQAVVSKIVY